jgi:hypothetical protein
MWFVSEEDEQRFAHALLASLLVHVLVLGYVRGVEPLRKSGVGGALNVSFRATAAAGQKPGGVAPDSGGELSQPLLKPAGDPGADSAPPLKPSVAAAAASARARLARSCGGRLPGVSGRRASRGPGVVKFAGDRHRRPSAGNLLG